MGWLLHRVLCLVGFHIWSEPCIFVSSLTGKVESVKRGCCVCPTWKEVASNAP